MKQRKRTFDLKSFLATGNGNGGGSVHTYKKNEVIFSQGDRCDCVFYIHHGDCKVSVISERGKEAVVALHGKGDFFGEGCLTGHPLRLATATAMNDVEVMRFDKAAIQRACFQRACFIFFSPALYKTAQSLPPPLVNVSGPSAWFTGVRWLRVGVCSRLEKDGGGYAR